MWLLLFLDSLRIIHLNGSLPSSWEVWAYKSFEKWVCGRRIFWTLGPPRIYSNMCQSQIARAQTRDRLMISYIVDRFGVECACMITKVNGRSSQMVPSCRGKGINFQSIHQFHLSNSQQVVSTESEILTVNFTGRMLHSLELSEQHNWWVRFDTLFNDCTVTKPTIILWIHQTHRSTSRSPCTVGNHSTITGWTRSCWLLIIVMIVL